MKSRGVGALIAVSLAATITGCAYYQETSESRVLAVGIDAYAYVNGLNECVSDARAIAQSLSADTKVVLAGEAEAPVVTKQTVLGAIDDAVREAPSGGYATFVFHYSGHGDDSNGGLLIMADATKANPFASGTTINPTELLAAIAAVPAAVRVVILDSCNSGLFVDEGSEVSTLPGDGDYSLTELIAEAAARFKDDAEGEVIVMSAAGAAELSQESSTIEHGYFTMGLLKSATEGDKNGDGLVTLTESFDYASKYVTEAFNKKYPYYAYYPRISGSPMDVVLFRTSEN
jgi:uncharacterized caspase-like protein